METIEQIAVRTRALSLDDSVGKASEVIRCSGIGAAPVVANGCLLGILTATEVARFLAEEAWECVGDPTETKLAVLYFAPVMVLPESVPPTEALRRLNEHGAEIAAVLDLSGGLVGLVSKAELVSAVCGRVRPPVIGGMATPFGVYLTGGGVRGGVNDLALAATGAYLFTLNLLAYLLADWMLARHEWATLFSMSGFALPLNSEWLQTTVYLMLFAVLFRLSWVTGYHAAEHQVVHTIELGDDLRPDVVRQKPRVHPRCGTNLVAAIMIMTLFWNNPTLDPAPPLVAMMATVFFWRRVGGWLQQYVTTRPATPRQLESGILAGRELMARYQKLSVPHLSWWRRVWNMGLLQVLSGSLLMGALLTLLQWLGVPFPAALRFF